MFNLFKRKEHGQGMLEYGIIIALVAVLGAAGFATLHQSVRETVDEVTISISAEEGYEVLIDDTVLKKQYYIDESPDPKGITVNKLYSSGLKKDVTTECDYLLDTTQPNNDATLYISWKNNPAGSQSGIRVSRLLKGVILNPANYSEVVFVGESIKHEGLSVMASYADNLGDVNVVADCSFSKVDTSREGVKHCTVTYGEQTAGTYDVSVVRKLKEIVVDRSSVPESVVMGESVDLSKVKVTAKYNDSLGDVDVSKSCTFKPASVDTSSVGTKSITVSYEGKNKSFNVNVERKLESISVDRASVPESVFVGDTVNLSGIKVIAQYADSLGDVTVTEGFTIDPQTVDTSSTGTKTVTVTYEGKSTSFDITVNRQLKAIVLDRSSIPTSVYVGEKVDLSNLKVTAQYNDSLGDVVLTSGYTLNPTSVDTASTGTKTVTVTVGDKTASFNIEVKRQLTGITVDRKSVPATVYVGASVDLSGIVVKAQYNDSLGEVTLKSSEYSLSPTSVNTSTTGTKTVTVTHEGKKATFNVVVERQLKSISVDRSKIPTSVYVGASVDLSGLVVKAQYNDSLGEVTLTKSQYSLSPATINTSSTGEKTVTVTHEGKTTTFAVTVNRQLTSIYVDRSQIPASVFVNANVDLSKLVVKATYNDSLGDVTLKSSQYTLSPATVDTTSTGEKTITVTHDSKTTSFTVNVVRQLTGITVSRGSVPTSVFVGNKVDLSSIVVKAQYNDSLGDVTLNSSQYTLNPTSVDTSSTGTKTITVSHNDKTASFTVNVTRQLMSISVDRTSVPTSVYVGASVDLSKIVVKAKYNDSLGDVTLTSSQYSLNPTSVNTATTGTKTITVSYGGKSSSFTVVVNRQLMSLDVDRSQVPTVTYLNESVDLSKIVVKAKYNDTLGDVTLTSSQYTLNPTSVSTTSVGTKTITVSYSGKTGSFDIEVRDPHAVYWWYDSANTTLHFSSYAITSDYALMPEAIEPGMQPYRDYCSYITTVEIDNLIKPKSTAHWFYWFESLTAINGMDNIDTSKVTNMRNMFAYCGSLTTLTLGDKFNTSSVTNMHGIFAGCYTLTTLNLGDKFDTSNVTTMSRMFYGCEALITLNLGNKFDTSNVEDMEYMFQQCNELTTLAIGDKFDTGNVVSMYSMFYDCTSLASLDLGDKFDTSSVTDMRCMFSTCSELTTLTLGDKFDTSSVTTMSNMFDNCSKLTSLDLSSFDTSKVTSMISMFNRCKELTTLTLGDKFDTSNVTSMYGMFQWCSKLTTLNLGDKFNTSNVTDMRYMFYSCNSLNKITIPQTSWNKITTDSSSYLSASAWKQTGTADPYTYKKFSSIYISPSGYSETVGIGEQPTRSGLTVKAKFADGSEIDVTKQCTYSAVDTSTVGNKTVTVSYNGKSASFSVEVVAPTPVYWWYDSTNTTLHLSSYAITSNYALMPEYIDDWKTVQPYKANRSSITTVIVENAVKPKSTACWFSGCTSLTSCNISELDTGIVTDMGYMFYNCSSLTSLDLSSFNTSNVTTMRGMFYTCSRLTSLDLSKFNTSNVTDMCIIFSGCSRLTSLDLSSFNTSNVTNMGTMFRGCSSLTSLDLSSFDTRQVKSMTYMFYNCSKLTSLDLSSFNTSSVTDMSYMFYNCSKLTSLDLNKFSTSNVKDMCYMFYNCSLLTSLDLSKFNTCSVTSMKYMFYNCSKLTSLDLSKFNTSNVTDMSYMFYNCSKLTSLDLSSFNTSNITNMCYMFYYCSSLTSLDLNSFNTRNVTNMYYMFYNCSSLTSIDLSSFNTSSVTNMSYMFCGCSSLTSLDLSKFDTSNVTVMAQMFNGCSKLTYLNLGKFVTNKVTTMGYMFGGCSSLTSLDLSSFDTSNVKYMGSMFWNCSKLIYLDLSKFVTNKVTTMGYMFGGCSSLTSLDLSSFDTSNVTDMNHMFSNCIALNQITIPQTSWSKITTDSSSYLSASGWTQTGSADPYTYKK